MVARSLHTIHTTQAYTTTHNILKDMVVWDEIAFFILHNFPDTNSHKGNLAYTAARVRNKINIYFAVFEEIERSKITIYIVVIKEMERSL